MNLIQQLEQEEIARLNKEIPTFAPGDTWWYGRVWWKVTAPVCKPTKAW